MTFHLNAIPVALVLVLLQGSAYAQGMAKADYEQRKDRVAAEYKVDKAACSKQAGNAADICKAEAKGKDRVALADLKHAYSGKAADLTKLQEAKAHAAYEVAEEKCDDLAGQPKDVCVQEAKAAKVKALADAKMGKEVRESRRDASQEKMDADYKVAIEKCDALSGAGKSDCVSAAKRQFGKN
jgi:hypothetical protein